MALLETSRKTGRLEAFAAELRTLASRDNHSALNVLAMLHREGLRDTRGRFVIEQDPRLAIRYEKRAAHLGDPESLTAIADRLTRHDRRSGNMSRAEKLYHRAFNLGYETAAYNLASAYQNRSRYRAAVRWFRKALAAGDLSALLPLGRAELYGIGTKRNSAAAFAKLRRLAVSKATYWPPYWLQCEAMLVLADALIEGWLARRDFEEGIRWLRRAAKLGSRVARARLEYHGAL